MAFQAIVSQVARSKTGHSVRSLRWVTYTTAWADCQFGRKAPRHEAREGEGALGELDKGERRL